MLNQSNLAIDEFNNFPSSGFVRIDQIIGNPEKGFVPVIPVKKATWWKGVKEGVFPRPLKILPQVTVWRAEDILAYIASVPYQSKD